MKVVHVIGGAERGGSRAHVISLCRHLPERRADLKVELVCLLDGAVAAAARRHGVPLTVLPMRHQLDLRAVGQLRRHLSRGALSIVHTHGMRANFIARLAARNLGVPIVTTVHSSMAADYAGSTKRWVYPAIEKLTRRYTDQFIAVASALKDELESDGEPAKRITVVYNCAPDDDDATPGMHPLRQELGLEADLPIVMSVGRLEPVKGPAMLLAILDGLRKRMRFHGVIAGDGSLSRDLRHQAQTLGLDRTVSFLGFREDVPALLSQADVLVLPSRMEGLSVTLLEAMRAGTPVVASAVGGLHEVVRLARNGFAVTPGDVETHVDRVEQVLSDPELRATFARSGTEALEEHFSRDAFLDGTLNVYERLVATRIPEHMATSLARSPRVTIAGYYGAGNTGDEAILAGLLGTLRDEGITNVTVLSFDAVATRQAHGVEALPIGRRFAGIIPLVRHLRHTDLFVLGGGGLLQDGSRRVVPFWLSRVLLAMGAGVPVAYCAIGVGPLRTTLARRLVALISNRVAAVTVRDPTSRSLLRACGVRRPEIEVSADPALCLQVTEDGRQLLADEGVTLMPDIATIAVCVRILERDEQLVDALVTCLDQVRQRHPVRYLFVPFHAREDPLVHEEIRKHLPSDDPGRQSHALRREYSPQQIAAMLGATDGVIAMRLHAAIFAAISGVPVFALVDDPKVKHFMESAAIASDSVTLTALCADPHATADRIDGWISALESRRRQMQPAIRRLAREARRNASFIKRLVRPAESHAAK